MRVELAEQRRAKAIAWLGVCAAVWLAQPRCARAEFFQYSSTISLSNISAPVLPANLVGNGTGSVSLTSASGTPFLLTAQNSSGPDNIDGSGLGTDIVYVGISATVTPATLLETVSFDYTFSLTIDDYGSSPSGGSIQGSGVFTIKGTLVERVGAGKKITMLSNTFTSPATQSQVIAGQQYTVSLYTIVPPGAANDGVFGLHVSPVAIPEPASLGLLIAGATSLAIPAYRSRRRTRS